LDMISRKMFDYIGDPTQIGGLKRYQLVSGKAKGVEAIDVDNGSGLLFTVLPDRGLDIHRLSFKGIPVSFLSKTGIVSPAYYNDRGDEWLRSFSGGFLTTCGLTQVGEPCTQDGQDLGMHGSVSNTSAENLNLFSDWVDDVYVVRITGQIRQAKVQYENLLMKRSIKIVLGENEIFLEDEVINEGDKPEPFMILYHINFGYPFLNPDSDIVIPSIGISGWDMLSDANADLHLEICEPSPEPAELTWYHEMIPREDGSACFMLANRKQDPDIAVMVRYDGRILDNLVQWRCLHKHEYVMAMEPCNNQVKGQAYERSHGHLKWIAPGEHVRIKLSFMFLSDASAIGNALKTLK
jgi:hypothetical protein